MVRDIAGGYILTTERTLRPFGRTDLDKVQYEIDRRLRGIRGDQPSLDDQDAIRDRNMKIQRLNSALVVLRAFRQRRKI